MTCATRVEKIALDVIKPLCPETERMFSHIRFESTDRIKLKMHKDGKHFHIELYGILPTGALLQPSYYSMVHFTSRLVDKTKVGACQASLEKDLPPLPIRVRELVALRRKQFS